METVKVALLGAGTVGSQVYRLLQEQAADLAARAGATIEVAAVAVRDVDAERDVEIPRDLLTTDAEGAIDDADIVIELIGGIEPPRTYVMRALREGKTVVTGNKALIAAHGPELYEAAAKSGADLYYEAAVAGAIPVVYGLRESLAGDRISSIMGIVNGTTNFILDAMATTGASYEEALAEAQRLGFAEADPTADVEGFDAAAKAGILASLAFHTRVSIDDVTREGITKVTAADMAEAKKSGHVVKLLALADRVPQPDGSEGISVRVHPALVPVDHPLATVDGVYNAVVVEGEAAGRLMFYGQGAGGAPTASAVLSDVVAAAWHIANGGDAPRELIYANLPILPARDAVTHYQIHLLVEDRVGVLAEVAGIFAEKGVSIKSVTQSTDPVDGSEEARDREAVAQAQGLRRPPTTLLIATHSALEGALQDVVEALALAPAVLEVLSTLRIEG